MSHSFGSPNLAAQCVNDTHKACGSVSDNSLNAKSVSKEDTKLCAELANSEKYNARSRSSTHVKRSSSFPQVLFKILADAPVLCVKQSKPATISVSVSPRPKSRCRSRSKSVRGRKTPTRNKNTLKPVAQTLSSKLRKNSNKVCENLRSYRSPSPKTKERSCPQCLGGIPKFEEVKNTRFSPKRESSPTFKQTRCRNSPVQNKGIRTCEKWGSLNKKLPSPPKTPKRDASKERTLKFPVCKLVKVQVVSPEIVMPDKVYGPQLHPKKPRPKHRDWTSKTRSTCECRLATRSPIGFSSRMKTSSSAGGLYGRRKIGHLKKDFTFSSAHGSRCAISSLSKRSKRSFKSSNDKAVRSSHHCTFESSTALGIHKVCRSEGSLRTVERLQVKRASQQNLCANNCSPTLDMVVDKGENSSCCSGESSECSSFINKRGLTSFCEETDYESEDESVSSKGINSDAVKIDADKNDKAGEENPAASASALADENDSDATSESEDDVKDEIDNELSRSSSGKCKNCGDDETDGDDMDDSSKHDVAKAGTDGFIGFPTQVPSDNAEGDSSSTETSSESASNHSTVQPEDRVQPHSGNVSAPYTQIVSETSHSEASTEKGVSTGRESSTVPASTPSRVGSGTTLTQTSLPESQCQEHDKLLGEEGKTRAAPTSLNQDSTTVAHASSIEESTTDSIQTSTWQETNTAFVQNSLVRSNCQDHDQRHNLEDASTALTLTPKPRNCIEASTTYVQSSQTCSCEEVGTTPVETSQPLDKASKVTALTSQPSSCEGASTTPAQTAQTRSYEEASLPPILTPQPRGSIDASPAPTSTAQPRSCVQEDGQPRLTVQEMVRCLQERMASSGCAICSQSHSGTGLGPSRHTAATQDLQSRSWVRGVPSGCFCTENEKPQRPKPRPRRLANGERCCGNVAGEESGLLTDQVTEELSVRTRGEIQSFQLGHTHTNKVLGKTEDLQQALVDPDGCNCAKSSTYSVRVGQDLNNIDPGIESKKAVFESEGGRSSPRDTAIESDEKNTKIGHMSNGNGDLSEIDIETSEMLMKQRYVTADGDQKDNTEGEHTKTECSRSSDVCFSEKSEEESDLSQVSTESSSSRSREVRRHRHTQGDESDAWADVLEKAKQALRKIRSRSLSPAQINAKINWFVEKGKSALVSTIKSWSNTNTFTDEAGVDQLETTSLAGPSRQLASDLSEPRVDLCRRLSSSDGNARAANTTNDSLTTLQGDAHEPIYCLSVRTSSSTAKRRAGCAANYHRGSTIPLKRVYSPPQEVDVVSLSEGRECSIVLEGSDEKEESSDSVKDLPCEQLDESSTEVIFTETNVDTQQQFHSKPKEECQDFYEECSGAQTHSHLIPGNDLFEPSLPEIPTRVSMSDCSRDVKHSFGESSVHDDAHIVPASLPVKTQSLVTASEAGMSESGVTDMMALLSQEASIKRYPSFPDLTDLMDDDAVQAGEVADILGARESFTAIQAMAELDTDADQKDEVNTGSCRNVIPTDLDRSREPIQKCERIVGLEYSKELARDVDNVDDGKKVLDSGTKGKLSTPQTPKIPEISLEPVTTTLDDPAQPVPSTSPPPVVSLGVRPPALGRHNSPQSGVQEPEVKVVTIVSLLESCKVLSETDITPVPLHGSSSNLCPTQTAEDCCCDDTTPLETKDPKNEVESSNTQDVSTETKMDAGGSEQLIGVANKTAVVQKILSPSTGEEENVCSGDVTLWGTDDEKINEEQPLVRHDGSEKPNGSESVSGQSVCNIIQAIEMPGDSLPVVHNDHVAMPSHADIEDKLAPCDDVSQELCLPSPPAFSPSDISHATTSAISDQSVQSSLSIEPNLDPRGLVSDPQAFEGGPNLAKRVVPGDYFPPLQSDKDQTTNVKESNVTPTDDKNETQYQSLGDDEIKTDNRQLQIEKAPLAKEVDSEPLVVKKPQAKSPQCNEIDVHDTTKVVAERGTLESAQRHTERETAKKNARIIHLRDRHTCASKPENISRALKEEVKLKFKCLDQLSPVPVAESPINTDDMLGSADQDSSLADIIGLGGSGEQTPSENIALEDDTGENREEDPSTTTRQQFADDCDAGTRHRSQPGTEPHSGVELGVEAKPPENTTITQGCEINEEARTCHGDQSTRGCSESPTAEEEETEENGENSTGCRGNDSTPDLDDAHDVRPSFFTKEDSACDLSLTSQSRSYRSISTDEDRSSGAGEQLPLAGEAELKLKKKKKKQLKLMQSGEGPSQQPDKTIKTGAAGCSRSGASSSHRPLSGQNSPDLHAAGGSRPPGSSMRVSTSKSSSRPPRAALAQRKNSGQVRKEIKWDDEISCGDMDDLSTQSSSEISSNKCNSCMQDGLKTRSSVKKQPRSEGKGAKLKSSHTGSNQVTTSVSEYSYKSKVIPSPPPPGVKNFNVRSCLTKTGVTGAPYTRKISALARVSRSSSSQQTQHAASPGQLQSYRQPQHEGLGEHKSPSKIEGNSSKRSPVRKGIGQTPDVKKISPLNAAKNAQREGDRRLEKVKETVPAKMTSSKPDKTGFARAATLVRSREGDKTSSCLVEGPPRTNVPTMHSTPASVDDLHAVSKPNKAIDNVSLNSNQSRNPYVYQQQRFTPEASALNVTPFADVPMQNLSQLKPFAGALSPSSPSLSRLAKPETESPSFTKTPDCLNTPALNSQRMPVASLRYAPFETMAYGGQSLPINAPTNSHQASVQEPSPYASCSTGALGNFSLNHSQHYNHNPVTPGHLASSSHHYISQLSRHVHSSDLGISRAYTFVSRTQRHLERCDRLISRSSDIIKRSEDVLAASRRQMEKTVQSLSLKSDAALRRP